MSINFLEQFPAGTRPRKPRADSRTSIAFFRGFKHVGIKVLLLLVVVLAVAVLSAAQSPVINQYPLPQQGTNPCQLTAGPDGAIWYTVSCSEPTCANTHNAIARITADGTMTEYPLPGPVFEHLPYGITAGPDGALWFTELYANKIGRITTAGVITEYPLSTRNAGAYEITSGPDGALWFTEMNIGKIGRITTTGVITEYPTQPVCCSDPTDIVAGPDGALWFTNLNSGWIGRMTVQGNVTTYPIPGGFGDYGIAVGPDNALWFAGGAPTGAAIWRVTTNGAFSMYDVPSKDAGLSYITVGSDHALWFTENYLGKIGRVTTGGVFTEYFVGGAFSTGPVAITTGPDGAVWFGKLGYVGQIVLPDTTPPKITVSASPNTLWPPNGKMVPVLVRGTVSDTGSGVLGDSVAYAVIDEYHRVQPTGHFALNSAGKYAFRVLLQASRYGNDTNGRQYRIQLSARDNAGNLAVKSIPVTVPHNP